MATTVFAVRITLQDHASPVTANSTVGLNNVNSSLAADASNNQPDVTVVSGSVFRADQVVTIKDDQPNNSETAVIKHIVGNVLTMRANLTNSYVDIAQNGIVNGNSVFQWIQNTVSGISNFKEDVLAVQGIGSFTRNIDLKRGGNISTPGSASVTVTNFINNTTKFYKELDDKSIRLNGLRAEIIEFSDSVEKLAWSGECEQPSWDTKVFRIPLKGSFNKRRTNLSTIITEEGFTNAEGSVLGKIVPLSFGSLAKAKFLRIGNKEEIIPATFDKTGFFDLDPAGNEAFNVTGGSNLTFTIKIANDASSRLAGALEANWIGAYLFVIEDAKEKGSFRRIASLGTIVIGGTTVDVNIAKHFANDLTSASWVQVIQINQDYQSDVWPGKDFLDSAGDIIVGTPETFGFDTDLERFNSLPNLGLQISGINSNLIDIDADFFKDNTDNLTGFIVEKVVNEARPSEADLNVTWENLDEAGTPLLKSRAGLHFNTVTGSPGAPTSVSNFQPPLDVSKAVDKDSTTFGEMKFFRAFPIGASGFTSIGFEFDLPKFPTGARGFSGTPFILCKANFRSLFTPTPFNVADTINHEIQIRHKRFIGASTLGGELTGLASDNVAPLPYNIRTFPDAYWTDAVSTNDKFFFKVDTTSATLQSGRTILPLLGVTDEFLYSAVNRNVLFFKFFHSKVFTGTGTVTIDFRLQISEVAILFIKEVNIKNEIFSGLSGRIFDDTWDGRKTDSRLIGNPLDLLEHVKRLKNWSENNPSPGDGWGKDYPLAPKIKLSSLLASNAASGQKNITVTALQGVRFQQGDVVFIVDVAGSEQNRINTIAGDVLTMDNNLANTYTTANGAVVDGDGSFDGGNDTDISTITGFRPGRQVLNEQEANTDRLERSLCKNFWMGSYVDKHGRECVKRLIRTESNINPAETLTLADIIDRQNIKIIDPNPADIFAEPFVRFNKNSANGEFQSSIRITNVDFENPTAAQKDSFVEGLEGGSAEILWDKANALYLKVNQITNPPSDMTDQSWADSTTQARRENIVVDYLINWIDWQANKRIIFKTHYNIAGHWEELHRFFISLPFQTVNVSIECILEKITVNPNPPFTVQIQAVMLLTAELPAEFAIQKVLNILPDSDDNWLKVLAPEGGDNDINKIL